VHQLHVMKVYFDEPSHVAISMMMHTDRMAVNPSAAHYQFGNLIFLDHRPSFRPVLYSFLVSTVHDLTGYRVANAFAVNAILGSIFFLLAYFCGRRLAGLWGGGVAVLLLATFPLLSQTIAGAGYDVLNIVLILGLFLASCRYLEQQDIPSLNLMVGTAVLLALTRNESVIYLLVPVCLAGWVWFRQRRVELGIFAAISPLLAFPSVVLHVIFTHTPAFVPARLREQGIGAFEWEFIPVNLSRVAHYLLSFDNTGTNSLLLAVLGVVGLVALYVHLAGNGWKRNYRLRAEVAVLAVVGTVALGLFLLMTSHFWNITDNQASRLMLPLHVVFALAGVWLLRELRLRPVMWRGAVVLVGVYLFTFSIPALAKQFGVQSSMMSRYDHWFMEYIAEHDDGRTLYVSHSPLTVLIRRLPATSVSRLHQAPSRLMDVIHEGIYDRVLIFDLEEFDPERLEWGRSPDSLPLPQSLAVREVARQHYFSNYRARIYQFVGLRDEEGEVVSLEEYDYERPSVDSLRDLMRYHGSILP